MSSAFDIIAKLRAGAGDDPDNLNWLKEQEERLKAILQAKNYSILPETQKVLALCRTAIVAARKALGSERSLTNEQRETLWSFIEARKWFLELVSRDYDSELEQIETELQARIDA